MALFGSSTFTGGLLGFLVSPALGTPIGANIGAQRDLRKTEAAAEERRQQVEFRKQEAESQARTQRLSLFTASRRFPGSTPSSTALGSIGSSPSESLPALAQVGTSGTF